MYTNIVLYIILAIIYFLLPQQVVFDILTRINQTFRTFFSEKVEETEKNIRETFKMNVLYPIPEKSINIWHPHGISGVTPVIHNGYRVTQIKNYKPTKGVVHSIYFMVPVVKDIIRLLNAIPSDYKSISDTLKNESISITIGGTDEMGRIDGKNIQLVIKRRRGIFKIALETGTPIVPVLTYGETDIFPMSENKFIVQYNNFLYDYFRMRFPFPTLKSLNNWLKLSATPLTEIKTYTGKPIIVKHIPNPSEKQIAKLRNLYIDRIRELFKKTNDGQYTLEII
jgi:2-acylglycerol O-acyltransferase 2